MKKKRLVSGLTVALALGTFLTGCGSSTNTGSNSQASNGNSNSKESSSNPFSESDDKPVELKLGHVLSPESHYQAMANKLAELAAEKSNGTIKITIFPQSQLGGEVKMIQSARTGTLGMFITAQAPLVNTIPEYGVFDLPYLFDSVDQANEVLAGPVGDKFLDMLPQHGMVGLGWLTALERNVFSSKSIRSVEDMSSLKVRVMQAPGYVKAYEALGAVPTPMAYSEVYLSLQQGVVDGGDTTPDQFIMDKFIEVAKYYNLTKVHNLPLLLIASKAQWDQLSPNQQKALQEAADEALAFNIEYYKKEYTDSLEKIKQAGVEVVETNVSSLKEQTMKAYDAILKDIPDGQKNLEEIEAAKK
ncbi:TRAP transporter substrate-binding protein [Ammoniphilus resinae]|uniref:Tripartite ATP-independent transporter DctP family solute receptor n=1 Tax=Ammoniphilus resinae TaxID=861532 RepID=A0ABS4GTN6_9BACL|nr:TRAP transporter substrate-binding protein [Ammoniphilus resinae]MBP1933646.1 tripartite ATP-independent transporter DctP family solute receptor [Ammoniphilus resinae]